MTLADFREEYSLHGLVESEAGDDPLALFHRWFEQAVHSASSGTERNDIGHLRARRSSPRHALYCLSMR